MRRCPECGEVCAYLYLRGIDVLGCECCVGMIDAVEIEEDEMREEGRWENERC